MKGFTALLLLLVSGLACAATIAVQDAYPSDAAGNPIAVNLGDTFYMTALVHVDAPLNGTYQLRFDLPYESRTTPNLNFGGDAGITWGPYTALLDTAIPVNVTVISSTDTPGQAITTHVTPKLPATGIEAFAPNALAGSVGATATLTSGTAAGLQWYAPVPSSDPFQNVTAVNAPGSVLSSTPYGLPVDSAAKIGTVNVQFSTTAYSSRVNPSILRTIPFSALSSLPASVALWLKPETLVESTSTDIKAFVAHSLPIGFKSSSKPYTVAQQLFQAVVAHMQYVETGTKPDALAALHSGRGDCGFFSALFVASCRAAGIPARTVAGMIMGSGQWHVWAELYLPGAGWIPADPAYADGICPDGSLPVYFGTVPDLDQRAALEYGFDRSVSGHLMTMLQSPAVFVSGTTHVSSLQSFCNLAFAPVN